MNQNLAIPFQAPGAPALSPADHNGGAISGTLLSFSHCSQICLRVLTGVIAGDVTLKVEQAKDSSGTDAKDLDLVAGRVFKRASGTTAPVQDDSLISSGAVLIPNADDNELIDIVVYAQDLDRDNGFNHIRIAGADPAVSALIAVFAECVPLAGSIHGGEPSMTGD